MAKKTEAERLEDIRSAVEQMSFAYKSNERIASIDEDLAAPASLEIEAEALRKAEAVLFAAGEPISAETLGDLLPNDVSASDILMTLQEAYRHRGVNLVEVDSRWRFQTAPDLKDLFTEYKEEDRKLSAAALETLAIIAYCQPVTRAEIEDVRGVAVSKGTLDILLQAGWVRLRGRRKTPGRPVTYGTTSEFMEHFGLDSLDSLPGKSEFQAAGLLDSAIPANFEMPRPNESEAGDEDMIDLGPQEEEKEFHTDFLEGETKLDDG